ncbi:hypothetical protein GQ55_9G365100 [Panicum hallii var. hallii]|uniref:Uncharacterized protein n=1 Tax=Panicum hallii var. hallii TaxID=1504633 RepID=A0A2T7C8T9_9POAL|nr:hypothetical protein GQ55_9G365100 [Panicum hallii var. hallii]
MSGPPIFSPSSLSSPPSSLSPPRPHRGQRCRRSFRRRGRATPPLCSRRASGSCTGRATSAARPRGRARGTAGVLGPRRVSRSRRGRDPPPLHSRRVSGSLRGRAPPLLHPRWASGSHHMRALPSTGEPEPPRASSAGRSAPTSELRPLAAPPPRARADMGELRWPQTSKSRAGVSSGAAPPPTGN